MSFQPLWLSIVPFQHFSYLRASDWLLSLCLQLAFFTHRSLYRLNPSSISPSCHCVRSVFHLISLLQASLWMAIHPLLQGLGPFLPPSHSCLPVQDDVVVCNALSICHLCQPGRTKGAFWCIDLCILCWISWWTRLRMLQDMDHMVASCGLDVEVGTFNLLEQSIICILTITTLEIPRLTVYHCMTCSVCFMEDLEDCLSYTSAVVLSVEDCAVFISQLWDFCSYSHRSVPVNINTILDQLDANRRMVGSPFNLQLKAAGFILCRTC